MSESFNIFMKDESVSIKTKELVSWLLNKNQDKGIQPDKLFEYRYDELEDYIVRLKPTSIPSISTYCYVISVYLKWCSDNGYCSKEQYEMVSDIDKGMIWKKVKPHVSKRFITQSQYLQIIDDISKYEELNSLYYKTLYECIYEGVYGEKLTELKELRASNINGTSLTISHDDGTVSTFEISRSLAQDLIELSNECEWERNHRYGTCKVKLIGKYPDSCFKVEFRNNCTDMEDAYRFFYYGKLRKIAEDYVGYKMLPLHIYQSGIINRICQTLVSKGIKVQDAFSENNRNPAVKQIIDAEINRVGYNISSNDFRFHVNSFLDMFVEEYD